MSRCSGSFLELNKENKTPERSEVKRVLFSPGPDLIRPSLHACPGSATRPPRSALKAASPTSDRVLQLNSLPCASGKLSAMITSAIYVLKRHERAARLEVLGLLIDAFRNLARFPDHEMSARKVNELFALLLDDLRDKSPGCETPDYPIQSRAATALGFLLHDEQLAGMIHTKQARSLMEFSLVRLEAADASKASTSMFLWLWQTQRLPQQVISGDICVRMILASTSAGFSSLKITTERLAVLTRLLDQDADAMALHCKHWLPYVIGHLFEAHRAVRMPALRIAIQAGRRFTRQPVVGACLQSHLKSCMKHGQTFLDLAAGRFKAIATEDDGGPYLAKVWAAICTLSSSQNPEKSGSLMPWMHCLQTVFQTAAPESKAQAQMAWLSMIYYFANNDDVIYKVKNIAFLAKPMVRIITIDTAASGKVLDAAFSATVALLYALNKPGLTFQQTELIWAEAVVPLLRLVLSNANLKERASQLLDALLRPRTCEIWSLERLLDDAKIDPQLMTPLDHKWMREHLRAVLELIHDCVDDAQIWEALMLSLRAATAKEVQPSAETTLAATEIVRFCAQLSSRELAAELLSETFRVVGTGIFYYRLEDTGIVRLLIDLFSCDKGAALFETSILQLAQSKAVSLYRAVLPEIKSETFWLSIASHLLCNDKGFDDVVEDVLLAGLQWIDHMQTIQETWVSLLYRATDVKSLREPLLALPDPPALCILAMYELTKDQSLLLLALRLNDDHVLQTACTHITSAPADMLPAIFETIIDRETVPDCLAQAIQAVVRTITDARILHQMHALGKHAHPHGELIQDLLSGCLVHSSADQTPGDPNEIAQVHDSLAGPAEMRNPSIASRPGATEPEEESGTSEDRDCPVVLIDAVRVPRRKRSRSLSSSDSDRSSSDLALPASCSTTASAGPVTSCLAGRPKGRPSLAGQVSLASVVIKVPRKHTATDDASDGEVATRQLTQEGAHESTDEQSVMEAHDDEVFLQQLRQYRKSLDLRSRERSTVGTPRSTRRRRLRLAELMREVAGLQGDITEAMLG
ncbi:hypothetical protein PYCC9005_000015 [Savitreella phatthalungensis]